MIYPNTAEKTLLSLMRYWLNNQCNLHLFTSDLTLDETTILADLEAVEADFSGYVAALASPFSAIAIDGSGKAYMDATYCGFQHNEGATPNTIYGWWLHYTGNGFDNLPHLVACHKYTTPITMATSDDVIAVLPRIMLSS